MDKVHVIFFHCLDIFAVLPSVLKNTFGISFRVGQNATLRTE